MTGWRTKKDIVVFAFIAVFMLLVLPFAVHAIGRGLSIQSPKEIQTSRLWHAEAPYATVAIYGHMIAGGLITLLAPLQFSKLIRTNWPRLHRVSGYGIAVLAVLTSVGGLIYIATQGTIGGLPMNIGFGLYGIAMLVSALMTVQFARQRDPVHRLWAERLIILAVASWLYRVHYGLWAIIAGSSGSKPDFTGPFDIIQMFAFYVPYLLLHQWMWHRRASRHSLLV